MAREARSSARPSRFVPLLHAYSLKIHTLRTTTRPSPSQGKSKEKKPDKKAKLKDDVTNGQLNEDIKMLEVLLSSYLLLLLPHLCYHC
jgi:hypothetical protein